MSNLTKAQRNQEESIKQMIMRGKRNGVCDGEGRSIQDEHGMPVAPPRTGKMRKIR